jgi:hypothetical protein
LESARAAARLPCSSSTGAGRDAATPSDGSLGDAYGDVKGATDGAGTDAAESGTIPDCPAPHGGRNVIGNVRVPRDYPTIQAALEGAADGSTVSVAAGTYFENIDFKGKAIRLASESGPELTIIEGNSSGPTGTDGNLAVDPKLTTSPNNTI